MCVYDIQTRLAITAAQMADGAKQRPRPGRKLIQLDLDVLQSGQSADLIAHEPSALGMGRVGQHVGQHQRTQHPLKLAL